MRALQGADGSEKFLMRLSDGRMVESVYLRSKDRRTICVSSQVGCVLDCAFCATGTMGFERNLTADEIAGQVQALCAASGEGVREAPTNIVFMGMGEPFHNYENVIEAARALSDPHGLSIAPGKITISTAGVLPMIQRFLSERHAWRLAVSVVSAFEEKRNRLMPATRRHSLTELRRVLESFPRRRIMLEVPLLGGINDKDEDAEALLAFCAGLRIRVNLIPWNPSALTPAFKRPAHETVLRFQRILRRDGMNVFIRNSLGQGVQSACGQLALRE